MRKIIFIICILFSSVSFGDILPKCKDGVCPVKSVLKTSGTVDPVQVATDAVKLDAVNLSKSNQDKVAAQKLLDKADADIKTNGDKLAADRLTLNALLDDIAQNKPAPIPKVVQLIEIASTTCDPCNKMQPIVDQLAKNGANVRRLNTDKENCPYAHSVTPTWIMLVDGKEVARAEGMYDLKRLQDWWDAMTAWTNKVK